LGYTAYKRYKESQKIGKTESTHIEAAKEFYQQAIERFPEDASRELAAAHNALGALFGDTGMCNDALKEYEEAISYCDELHDLHISADYRFNAAKDLVEANMINEALMYARSAIDKYKECGIYGGKKAQEVEYFIKNIENSMIDKS
jgi:tetratricopeptide (TPR) repeat protein